MQAAELVIMPAAAAAVGSDFTYPQRSSLAHMGRWAALEDLTVGAHSGDIDPAMSPPARHLNAGRRSAETAGQNSDLPGLTSDSTTATIMFPGGSRVRRRAASAHQWTDLPARFLAKYIVFYTSLMISHLNHLYFTVRGIGEMPRVRELSLPGKLGVTGLKLM